MTRQHNCAECRYLTRTSPEQVFLLCAFWSDEDINDATSYVPEDFVGTTTAYSTLHSHMQPEAPACPAFKPRAVAHGAA